MADFFPLHSGNFAIEMDGVTVFEATEVSGGDLSHDPPELMVGTRHLPVYGRGKSKIETVKFKHAKSINAAGAEVYRWFDDFRRGIVVEPRNFRVVQLDQNDAPIETTDYFDCVPVKFTPVDNKADGKDVAFFNAEIQPSDIDHVA